MVDETVNTEQVPEEQTNVPVARLETFGETARVAPIACRTLWASSSCAFVGIAAVISGVGRSSIGEREAPEDDEDEVTLSLRPECGPLWSNSCVNKGGINSV